MDLINVLVIHKSWGQGIIVTFDNKNLFVKFNNKPLDKDTDTIRFLYPSAFVNGFLKIIDNDELQQEILREAIEQEVAKMNADQLVAVSPTVIPAKKSAKKSYKRENIAFKCNYCDGGASAAQVGFSGVCSKNIIKYNIKRRSSAT